MAEGDSIMKWGQIIGASSVACLLASGSALAQDVDPELTMRLVPDGVDLPAVVTQDIVLPEAAALEGVENSAAGLLTANENRARAAANREEALMRAEQNRQTGLDVAAEARERGAEFGSEIGEAARENRENFVRGGAGLDLVVPDHLPDLPGQAPANLPDLPALPEIPAPPIS
jgi:hypothetical protein